jgi:hypothetical protein
MAAMVRGAMAIMACGREAIMGPPYGGGPQYGSGGGDQYGYGPGYSYAREAPNGYYGWR